MRHGVLSGPRAGSADFPALRPGRELSPQFIQPRNVEGTPAKGRLAVGTRQPAPSVCQRRRRRVRAGEVDAAPFAAATS